MNIFAYLSLISSLLSFFLGTVIIVKNSRQLENKIFSIICYLVFLLALVEFFLRAFENYQDVILWNKSLAIIAFIPCLLLHFVLVINEKLNEVKNTGIYSIIYGPGILFYGLGTFTDLLGKGYERKYWGWTYGVTGTTLYIFFLWLVLVMIYCFAVCIQNYKKFPNVNKRMQIRYISIAIIIGLVIFVVFDTSMLEAFNIELPGMSITGFSIICAIITYSMLKHGLFLVNFQDLLETSTRGFIEIDVNRNKVKYINPILLKIIGYSADEVEKLLLYPDMIYPADLPNLIQNKEITKLEFRVITKSGIEKWLSGDKIAKYNKEGELIGLRLWLDDVTDVKNLEILKGEFLRRASHELKTPLISIKGFTELILSSHGQELDSEVIDKLNEITLGCNRLHTIIEDLLKSSRLEASELVLQKENEDLAFLIRFCVDELKSLSESRKQSIKLDIHDTLIAYFEKEELHDVLINLLTNAIKYTQPKGKIIIKTQLSKDSITISIKDNGIGFADDDKNKIFKQFGKIERYGQGLDLDINGTGLGLYISKRIVESHGGKIWLESDGINKGSTFFFTIPAGK